MTLDVWYLGQATNFSRTVYWLDFLYPSSFVGILNYSVTASGASGLATISGFFNAQDDGGVGLLPGGVDPADIIVMDTSLSHDPFAFSAPFLTGQVVMGLPKANPPTGVIPLPAAGLLLLSAFGGMAVFAHRNGQKRRLNA